MELGAASGSRCGLPRVRESGGWLRGIAVVLQSHGIGRSRPPLANCGGGRSFHGGLQWRRRSGRPWRDWRDTSAAGGKNGSAVAGGLQSPSPLPYGRTPTAGACVRGGLDDGGGRARGRSTGLRRERGGPASQAPFVLWTATALHLVGRSSSAPSPLAFPRRSDPRPLADGMSPRSCPRQPDRRRRLRRPARHWC